LLEKLCAQKIARVFAFHDFIILRHANMTPLFIHVHTFKSKMQEAAYHNSFSFCFGKYSAW